MCRIWLTSSISVVRLAAASFSALMRRSSWYSLQFMSLWMAYSRHTPLFILCLILQSFYKQENKLRPFHKVHRPFWVSCSPCREDSWSRCRCHRQTHWHHLQICTSLGSPGFYSGNCFHCVTQQYSASTPKTFGTLQVIGAGREISASSCVDESVILCLKSFHHVYCLAIDMLVYINRYFIAIWLLSYECVHTSRYKKKCCYLSWHYSCKKQINYIITINKPNHWIYCLNALPTHNRGWMFK